MRRKNVIDSLPTEAARMEHMPGNDDWIGKFAEDALSTKEAYVPIGKPPKKEEYKEPTAPEGGWDIGHSETTEKPVVEEPVVEEPVVEEPVAESIQPDISKNVSWEMREIQSECNELATTLGRDFEEYIKILLAYDPHNFNPVYQNIVKLESAIAQMVQRSGQIVATYSGALKSNLASSQLEGFFKEAWPWGKKKKEEAEEVKKNEALNAYRNLQKEFGRITGTIENLQSRFAKLMDFAKDDQKITADLQPLNDLLGQVLTSANTVAPSLKMPGIAAKPVSPPAADSSAAPPVDPSAAPPVADPSVAPPVPSPGKARTPGAPKPPEATPEPVVPPEAPEPVAPAAGFSLISDDMGQALQKIVEGPFDEWMGYCGYEKDSPQYVDFRKQISNKLSAVRSVANKSRSDAMFEGSWTGPEKPEKSEESFLEGDKMTATVSEGTPQESPSDGEGMTAKIVSLDNESEMTATVTHLEKEQGGMDISITKENNDIIDFGKI